MTVRETANEKGMDLGGGSGGQGGEVSKYGAQGT